MAFGGLGGAVLAYRLNISVPETRSMSLLNAGTVSVHDAYLDPWLADGFCFPFGNKEGGGTYTDPSTGKTHSGWYIATHAAETYFLGIHTGEDWNGTGGGDSDFGQPVYSTAHGKVLFAGECPSPWGNCILIEHRYLENGTFCTVFSQYSHLNKINVKKGDMVKRGHRIGTIGKGNHNEYPAHLHFEIRKENMRGFDIDYWPSSHGKTIQWVKEHYEDPSGFIKARRKLSRPADAKKMLLIVKSEYKAYLVENGKVIKQYEIALGQVPQGRKELQGDLKVPEGEYKILEKTTGPFDASRDWSKAYLGTRWMRLSYPNRYDAKRGLEAKRITKKEHDAIVNADKKNKFPPKTTALGGGIGIHGWLKQDWDVNGDRDLTWGCVSLRRAELHDLFEKAEVGMKVLISR